MTCFLVNVTCDGYIEVASIALGGGFGGFAAYLKDKSAKLKSEQQLATKREETPTKTSGCTDVIIGVAAAFAVAFFFIQARIMPIDGAQLPFAFVLSYYFGLACISGYVAHPLLEKVGNDLLDRIKRNEETISDATKDLSEKLRHTEEELDRTRHASVIIATAISVAYQNGLEQKVYEDSANNLKQVISQDSSWSKHKITLAALMKRAGQTQAALDIIQDYIKELHNAKTTETDNYYISRFNECCYMAILGKVNEDTTSALKEAIEKSEPVRDHIKNKNINDPDIAEMKKFPELNTIIDSQK